MYLKETSVHPLFSSLVTVIILKILLSIQFNFVVLGMRGNQHFVYNTKTFNILHVSTRLCLDCDIEMKTVFMDECNKTSKTQRWSFLSYNETLILKDLQKFFL